MKKQDIYSFINAVKIAREKLPDDIALETIDLYPSWAPNKELKINDRIKFNNHLYKVIQAHTTQSDWQPDIALTLFSPIDMVNSGTLDKPIIAAIGMTYFKDKYYLDETDNKIYLCIRDDNNGNGTTLYHAPNVLVNNYFKIVD